MVQILFLRSFSVLFKDYLAESSVCNIKPGDKNLSTVSSDVILILNCSSEIRGVRFDFVEWSINGKPIGKEGRVEQNSRKTWSALFLTNVTSDRDTFQCKLTKKDYRSTCDVTPGKQRQILVSFILIHRFELFYFGLFDK